MRSGMTLLEVIRALADDSPLGIVITDAEVKKPGPIILYANEAFGRLIGRPVAGVIGISPRFMQGRETRRPILDTFAQSLAAGERFHGYLTNYRGDGTKYVVEIDCHPLRNAEGRVEYFLAFEREVARRRGRPWGGLQSRFEPTQISNVSLTREIRMLGAFQALTEVSRTTSRE
jgi:PAS domain S-box-containing protein